MLRAIGLGRRCGRCAGSLRALARRCLERADRINHQPDAFFEAGADSRMVAHILAHFDFDGSGMIEREEFLAMVDRLPPPISQVRAVCVCGPQRCEPLITDYRLHHIRRKSSSYGRSGRWKRNSSARS